MTIYAPKSITASRALTASDAGAALVVDAAAGLTLTLPAATGSGMEFNISIGTTVTSNNVIVAVANASDTMTGTAINAADSGDTAVAFETASDSDTITMNGSTKGGYKGDRICLVDIKANLWAVTVIGAASGSEASPFSAAVS